jgi:hypothetical protein
VNELRESAVSADSALQVGRDLPVLFHRLNNQLGIILAHAELLEAKAPDDMNRARAAQVVSGALDAMGTAKEIRRITATSSVDPQ